MPGISRILARKSTLFSPNKNLLPENGSDSIASFGPQAAHKISRMGKNRLYNLKDNCFRGHIVVALAIGLLALVPSYPIRATQPVLSPPVLSIDGTQAQIILSNCGDYNVQYLLQMSTNLINWTPVVTNAPSTTNRSVTAPVSNPFCFFRVLAIQPPLPTSISQLGILCKSKFDYLGNNCTVDSFDSSNPLYSVGGQYDPIRRKANGSVAAYAGITNSLNVGLPNIYGHVYTGVGTTINSVDVGTKGTVGNLAWVNGGNAGIQYGYWTGNLNLNVPDVAVPNTIGWSTSLPPASNGVITLNGGNYVVASLSTPLLVKAPTFLWVQSSLSLGVTMTNTGSLILYVGTTSGSGMSLSWSGNGTCNVPGYAANLQIYGLPSLTSIDLHGNSAWIGTVYAPEAAFVGGGGGNNTQDVSGQIVVNNLLLNGHWNFHFDENLTALNLFH
jgi:hypothetical protein